MAELTVEVSSVADVSQIISQTQLLDLHPGSLELFALNARAFAMPCYMRVVLVADVEPCP